MELDLNSIQLAGKIINKVKPFATVTKLKDEKAKELLLIEVWIRTHKESTGPSIGIHEAAKKRSMITFMLKFTGVQAERFIESKLQRGNHLMVSGKLRQKQARSMGGVEMHSQHYCQVDQFVPLWREPGVADVGYSRRLNSEWNKLKTIERKYNAMEEPVSDKTKKVADKWLNH